MEGNQLLHHAIPELTGTPCKQFLRYCSRSLKRVKKQKIWVYSMTVVPVCMFVAKHAERQLVRGQEKQKQWIARPLQEIKLEESGGRDACSQVSGRQTRITILISGGIIGRWGEIVWILVRSMILDNMWERNFGGKIPIRDCLEWGLEDEMLHRDGKRLGTGAEGTQSGTFRVVETRCLFCGMRESQNWKAVDRTDVDLKKPGRWCGGVQRDKSRSERRRRNWIRKGKLQLGPKCKRKDL